MSDLSAAIQEGAKKSGIGWLDLDRPRLAWHAWHDGALYVVTAGQVLLLPGLGALSSVRVTLRSKDNGARLVDFEAAVTVVDQAAEPDAIAALAKERLNARDCEHLTERWAESSTVVRLTPQPVRTGRVTAPSGVAVTVKTRHGMFHGWANGASTTAAPVIPQAIRPSGSTSAPKLSLIRKYPAQHAPASSPRSRPSASSRSPDQASTLSLIHI